MWVTAYTDASFKDGVGGWAVWLRSEKGRIIRSGECPSTITSSSLAELFAVTRAIELAKEWWPETKGVLVNTDSTEIIHYLNNRHNRIATWSHVVNALLRTIVEAGVWLKAKHIKGHTNGSDVRSYLNRRVDAMAGQRTGKYQS